MEQKMTRIGVFYDGNYFLHVSNYYNYDHAQKRRLSITGLHDYIKHQVALQSKTDVNLCQIVDAHYFRGRLSAHEASQRGYTLYWDRVFDDVLMSAGVTTHYLPLRVFNGRREEKGIDVWLALEVFEQTLYKRFDVLVLITSDGDYVPLVRKINTLGTRVMVVSWDFEYTTDTGKQMITRTSQDLLAEVTYPIAMHDVIDKATGRRDPLVEKLFVQGESRSSMPEKKAPAPPEDVQLGKVHSLKNGYGFISFPPNNLFFHYTSIVDGDFNELQIGDEIEFTIGLNDDGQQVAQNVRLLWWDEEE
jgi:uncharacterized LabA/DUF88 family protein/cold shock CspA family protein